MGRLHGRLATLEKRFIPDPNAARDEVLQRALARLTIQELKLLIEAATWQEEGREGEPTAEHHAASQRLDDVIAEGRALASGRR
jgi:hypothetical protein